MLTPEEFKKQMDRIFPMYGHDTGSDLEATHLQADKLMCALLTELGYGEGIEIFKNADKWYA